MTGMAGAGTVLRDITPGTDRHLARVLRPEGTIGIGRVRQPFLVQPRREPRRSDASRASPPPDGGGGCGPGTDVPPDCVQAALRRACGWISALIWAPPTRL